MNRCNNCKREFEDAQYIHERERIDYGIGSEWVTLFKGYVCPHCESTDYEEVIEDEEDA